MFETFTLEIIYANACKMDESLIKKSLIHAGTKNVTISSGCKVCFHYCTRKCDADRTVIDDSKKTNSPMELIIGKKFKFDVWEAAVKTMALHEVASFVVDKSLLQSYPFISKTLRNARHPHSERKNHCCIATFQNFGVGYDDLNELLKDPCDLEFILEVLSVESPDEYEKESWQMEEGEKLEMVPKLKEEGNKLYNNKEYDKAAAKYALAIGMLEELMLKEKPKDKEWNVLNKMKLPILLNYAQCKLVKCEYYSVIEHCTTVLESDPKNVKAFFRRGKAHVGAWNFKEAESDLKKVAVIDPKLENLVLKELKEIEFLKKVKDAEEKSQFLGKFFKEL